MDFNSTMEKINGTIKIYAQVLCFLIIWAAVVLASTSYSAVDVWAAIKKIPAAISIYALVGIVFVKWAWRWPILRRWLIKVPDLQGTWRGRLKSDWVNPDTGQGVAPIPIVIVIRQTFASISVVMMTPESSSYSTAAEINALPGTDQIFITYTYTNRPKATIRDRSQIHDGAANLKVAMSPPSLEGEYWTSRKTRGDFEVSLESRKLAEKFS